MQIEKEVNIVGKTRKIMAGITTTALTFGLIGCGSNSANLPPKPTDPNCDDWDWDDDKGVWACDDDSSSHRGHYYYGGNYYNNKNSLLKSSAYKSYKDGSSFKGGIKTSSGFGSGSKVFGG